MSLPPLCLAGTLRQSDAADLQTLALAHLDTGAIAIRDGGLAAVECGVLQVLLCLSRDARRLGLPCTLDASAVPAIEHCLAALHLPAAATFFTIVPTTEMSATP